MANRASFAQTLRMFGLTLLLLFIPLIKAGNRPWPLLLAELLAVALLVSSLWSREPVRLPQALKWLLGAALLLPLVFLIPIPLEWWQALPGRAPYAQALAAADAPAWRVLSLSAYDTLSTWLALLPAVAVVVATATLHQHQIIRLVYIFLGICLLQALLGFAQLGADRDSALVIGGIAGHTTTGTYVNRNHFAGLLEMALPITLGMGLYSIGAGAQRRHGQGLFGRLASNRVILMSSLTVIFVAALLLSRSRTGALLAVMGLIPVALVFSRRLGGGGIYGLTASLIVIALAIVGVGGLLPLLERFASPDAFAVARGDLFASVWQGARAFFPVGSGPGTFAATFPQFQSPDHESFISHAHNGYLELIWEFGVLGIVAAGLYFVLYLRQWLVLMAIKSWHEFDALRAGSGLGVLLLLTHELLDFNLHIPANLVYFSLLNAVFFIPRREPNRSRSVDRRVDHSVVARKARADSVNPANADPAATNPFLDND